MTALFTLRDADGNIVALSPEPPQPAPVPEPEPVPAAEPQQPTGLRPTFLRPGERPSLAQTLPAVEDEAQQPAQPRWRQLVSAYRGQLIIGGAVVLISLVTLAVLSVWGAQAARGAAPPVSRG
jgi:hypothetical protein